MTERETRICVVGDELSVGVGDPRALGWVGRVMARSRFERPAMHFTLAVPGETTSGLGARWEAETVPRFGRETENRLVIALGRHDVTAGLSIARSRLNLANILDVAASAQVQCFVVGPPPGNPVDGAAIEDLSDAFADVASRRRVPYVDTYTPLAQHEQWLADLAQNGSLYPGQAGYGLMAWLVLHTGWHAWLGLPDQQSAG
ncbi:acyl-CoA thioesterase I precursor [Xylanimonas cellulosilytica DSM 15894]|uniref:Acyl-CoA thioesterase I n=1 Tax=Xylanimonas cellulosilytica (strain DSM 15894 / JCM 12276 / CECT 5975 / KCTC 9989 / LMG 20990 / NBRC 107835 / XIL07) TaxID=446471 RepID=D1BWG0_XYLCX|nr:GDSL-type esterase/lipase family protein [Xylanimonas cellulosilytica]ACZ31505.1 acyl-CoA thioesterase I precursor [Xylanimonas cellulosilytica DSM 15894]